MCEIYTHPQEDHNNSLSALGLGGLCVVAAFALLPVLSQFQELVTKAPIPQVTTNNDIPNFIIPDDIPPPIETKEIIKPEVDIPPPTFDLQQMELLINPGDGGVNINTGWGTTVTADDVSIEVFLPSQLDQQPRVLVAASPLYPYSMKGINGQVMVEFVIDVTGRVKRPRVVDSTHREFEKAALEAVLRSKWQPGEREGAAVQTLVRLPVIFNK